MRVQGERECRTGKSAGRARVQGGQECRTSMVGAHLFLYRPSPRVGLWWRLGRAAVGGLVDGRRDGRVGDGVHGGGIGALRQAALQRRVVWVGSDGRVMDALVGALCRTRVGVGVRVAGLLAVLVSSTAMPGGPARRSAADGGAAWGWRETGRSGGGVYARVEGSEAGGVARLVLRAHCPGLGRSRRCGRAGRWRR